MSPMKSIAAVSVAGLIAVPVVVVTAGPAAADLERTERCGSARYLLAVDREGSRFDVDAEIDGAVPGSRWRIILQHEGRAVSNVVRTAGPDREIEVDRFVRNTPGVDRFRLTVRSLDTGASCSTRIVTS